MPFTSQAQEPRKLDVSSSQPPIGRDSLSHSPNAFLLLCRLLLKQPLILVISFSCLFLNFVHVIIYHVKESLNLKNKTINKKFYNVLNVFVDVLRKF